MVIIFKGDNTMIKASKFNKQCITYSQMNLIFNARLFWRRFSLWIRIYLVDRYFGIGTAEEAFGRLYLENNDLGDMLRIIFGRRNANNYTQLLSQYTFELRDLVSAQLAGNTEEMSRHVNNLYENINNRAAFLASINPYLHEDEWKNLLGQYLQYTLEEANAFASKNYAEGIRIFDQMTELTNRMGDTFAEGLYDYVTSDCQCDCSPAQANRKCFTMEQVNRIYDIRMFWYELAYWTRAYMLARHQGVGDVGDVLARLKQVPDKYISGLLSIFGTQYIQKDTEILNRYIELVDTLITALSTGNTDEANKVVQDLYANAEERAAFLASINPYWSKDTWMAILNSNIRSTIDEFNSFLTNNYAQNLDIFSTILDQAEYASDYYEQGLLNYLVNQASEKGNVSAYDLKNSSPVKIGYPH